MYLKANVVFLIVQLNFINLIAQSPTIKSNKFEYKCDLNAINKENNKKLNKDDINIMGFEIGNSNFKDIMKLLGETKIFKTKPTKNVPTSMPCIGYLSEKDSTYLIFQSGPLGGWEYITEFRIGKINTLMISKNLLKKCSKIDSTVATKSGIKIGFSYKELIKQFGEPTLINKNKIEYYFESQEKLNEKEFKKIDEYNKLNYSREYVTNPYYNVFSGLEAQIRDGNIIWFRIYYTKST